jgi:predicted alpha/beta superfamily hydrolase
MSHSSRFLQKWVARRRSPPGRLEVIEDVASPELGNRRDILVYLPAVYDRSEEPFPVIYMHDGQNLFDPATSFAGDWGLDSALARAPRKSRRVIIVGIPNTGVDRIREYSPFADPHSGGGLGDVYLDFVLNTVKPLVDERFRTLPDPLSTGIAGSSLGGLISLYAFFARPGRFGFAAALSPAFWFGDRAIFGFVEQAPFVPGRLYLDVGSPEGEDTVADARRMRDLLEAKGYRPGRDLLFVEDRTGMHNESSWGRRFRGALPFLVNGERAR